MEPRDFTYWLQGFMELENPESLDAEKTQMIKDHLALVFKKETPDRNIQSEITYLGGSGYIDPKSSETKDKEWDTMHKKLSWSPSYNINWDEGPPISC